MAGYTIKDRLIDKTTIAIGASETDTPVTRHFQITHEDSKHLLVRVEASSTTVSTGITAKIQHSFDGGTSWIDGKTVAISGDGDFGIEVNVSDGSDALMWPLGRIVVSSGSGDAADIDAVFMSNRL